MELTNETRHPALLPRAAVDEDYVAAAVLVRVTYRIDGGRLIEDPSLPPWPMQPGPWQGPHGPMPGDEALIRDGFDVMVFGSARAPGGRPVERMNVKATIGAWSGGVMVTGDRTWRRSRPGGPLTASAPSKFSELPLRSTHGYGGIASLDGLELPHPVHPEGRGFYLEEAQAEGRPLPNIEAPSRPQRSWDEYAEPAGMGACPLAGRGRHLLASHEGGERPPLARINNAAYTDLIAPESEAHPGARLVLEGISHDGPIAVELPGAPVKIGLSFGTTHTTHVPDLDQVAIEPDAGRAFVTYRYSFMYKVVPGVRRRCVLAA